MKMFHKSLLKCLAASTLAVSINTEAASITANFTSTVSSGDFIGSAATGSFTYDDSLIFGVGFEQITATQGLTVNLTVFGQTFTETDDIDFFIYDIPSLEFIDGNVSYLDFYMSETPITEDGLTGDNITSINLEGINDFGGFSLNLIGTNTYDGEFFVNEVSAVPVPAAAWLFGSGLIGLISVARRKKT